MKISGTLKLDGSILSNGLASLSRDGGGASGGSIHLMISSFTGLGKLTANGGSGLAEGNGGGGGCIAVHVDSVHLFQGAFQSFGGDGKVVGGAGTVYVEDNKKMVPRFVRRILDAFNPRVHGYSVLLS